MDKVLIIVGDAVETVDTLYPYYRLQEEQFVPVVAALEKRRYQMVMHEAPPGWTITREWEGYTIQADVAFRDVDPEDYLGIFFSGGRIPSTCIRSGSGTHHTSFLRGKETDCQRLPWRRDSGVRRLRARSQDGDGSQMPLRPRSLRRRFCGCPLCCGRQPGQRPHLS